MSNVTSFRGPDVPDYLRKQYSPQDNKALATGAGVPYPVLGMKGKIFKASGPNLPEPILLRDRNQNVLPYMHLVIVEAQEQISKMFYIDAYREGQPGSPPDCFSLDGKAPDDRSPQKQNPICATCKHNAWGSKGDGSRGKACQDRRRLAVVPYGRDLTNERIGGPMLFSVPPGSLQPLSKYALKLDEWGLPFWGVVTKMSFHETANFQLVFEFSKCLSEEEVEVIQRVRHHRNVPLILQVGAELGDPSEHTTGPAEDPGNPPPTADETGSFDAGGEDEDEGDEDEAAPPPPPPPPPAAAKRTRAKTVMPAPAEALRTPPPAANVTPLAPRAVKAKNGEGEIFPPGKPLPDPKKVLEEIGSEADLGSFLDGFS